MNKLAVLLLASVASNGVFADEVGANLQSAEPVTLAYVVADAGTSNSEWAIGPVNTPATAAEHDLITKATEAMNARVLLETSIKLYKNLENSL